MTTDALSRSAIDGSSDVDKISSNGNGRMSEVDDVSARSILLQTAPTTIVIIESRALIRDCLLQSFNRLCEGETILAFSSIDEWQAAIAHSPPATIIVLCSAGRKNPTGHVEMDIGRLREMETRIPIILLSDVEDAECILNALDSGVKGYIPTSISLDVAVEAIHLVKAGGVFVPASSLLSSRRSIEEHAHATKSQACHLFTERQTAVVGALRQGKANKLIAYELNMQESTVKVHIRNIMRKLKAKNRTEVAVLTQDLFLRGDD